MPDFAENVDQAKAAYRYYINGDRSIAWDPASRRWLKVVGSQPTAEPPGLSARALERIAKLEDAKRRGLVSNDVAEGEILAIIREES